MNKRRDGVYITYTAQRRDITNTYTTPEGVSQSNPRVSFSTKVPCIVYKMCTAHLVTLHL